MSVESRVPVDGSERVGTRPQWAGEEPARGGEPGVVPGAGETRSPAGRAVEPDEARPAETITEVAPQKPDEDDPDRPGEPSEVITEIAPDDPINEAAPGEPIIEVAPDRPEDDPFGHGDPSEVITEVAPDDPTEDDPYEPSEVITEVAPDDPEEDPLTGPITEIAPETVPEGEAE